MTTMTTDFIPKIPFVLYEGQLTAHIWEDTPTWVCDLQAALPREPIDDYVWRLCACAVHSFSGKAAPDAEAFPPLCRDAPTEPVIAARARWLRAELPLRATQRLLHEVQQRSILKEETLGN